MAGTGKIFVADDDPVLLHGLDVALRGRGYTVRTAGSGAELLSLMERDCPDLVILDVMMPGMDGLEVLREVHAGERWPNLPVVIMTAVTDAGVMAAAKKGGAAAVLSKPFRLAELVGRIERCLGGAAD